MLETHRNINKSSFRAQRATQSRRLTQNSSNFSSQREIQRQQGVALAPMEEEEEGGALLTFPSSESDARVLVQTFLPDAYFVRCVCALQGAGNMLLLGETTFRAFSWAALAVCCV